MRPLLTEALHGASSNAGWQCQILCGFAWSQFFSTFGLLADPINNIGPAIADQMFGWLALSGSVVW